MTSMDPWFLHQMKQITDEIKAIGGVGDGRCDRGRAARGEADGHLRRAACGECGSLKARTGTAEVRALRKKLGVKPVFKLVDTCAAEFESYTPYLYSCYDEEDEAAPTAKQEDHHSGQRAEPDRAGNRVRLLLLPCGVCAARRWLRDHHGELQSGDGVDRLRHQRPAVLRAADAGGRAGGV